MKLVGQDVVVITSMGISIFPQRGKDAASLLKNADMAMYFAKRQGRSNFQLFDDEIHYFSQKKLDIQSKLRNGLKNSEFFMHYQPVINLKTGEICSVEALLRWQHPHFGILHPNEFIIAAEESGLILQLGELSMRMACMQNIAMGHGLKLKVIAEGVETREQLKLLEDLDCDFGQGYLFSLPLSAEELAELIRNKSALPHS